MKAPIKPVKPTKPFPPNKEQTTHKHSIDIKDLFIKEIYYDDDGNEISYEQYDAGNESGEHYAFDNETKEFTPRLIDLLKLIPAHVNEEDIFIELDLSSYGKERYDDDYDFQGIRLFYTTPFIYQDELDKYNKLLVQYEKDLATYNVLLRKYKAAQEVYKEHKAAEKLEDKKAALEAQLALLNKVVDK